MSILPQEIWEIIIKCINDFSAWRSARRVSKFWYAIVYASEHEQIESTKLQEFVEWYNSSKIEEVSRALDLYKPCDATHVRLQLLPNGTVHGSVIFYDKDNNIIIDTQYYCGKRAGLCRVKYPNTEKLCINDTRSNTKITLNIDEVLCFYENDIPIFNILLCTRVWSWPNDLEHTFYLYKSGLTICLGSIGKGDAYVHMRSNQFFEEKYKKLIFLAGRNVHTSTRNLGKNH